MLIRIVKMHFKEGTRNQFLGIFNTNKKKIQSFQGCTHLELLEDFNDDHTFITYSHWKDEEALNQYRSSKLFAVVWKQTKELFSDKPIAFSAKPYSEND